MNKRSKITFGLLALIAVFGLVLTGCPDPNTDSSSGSGYTPPTAVVKAAGSHGTAGSGTFTGLTEGTVYAVLDVTTGRWYGALADGTLGAGTTLTAALTEAAALDATAGAEVRAIADPLLVNGRTYSVYAVDTTTTANGDDIGTGGIETGGKNTIITDDTGFDTAADVLNFVAGAFNNSSIVFVTDGTNTLKKNEAKTANATTASALLRGTATKLDYTIARTAGSAALAATVNTQSYFVITGTADFTGTVTASTAASNAGTLATGSQGTTGDDKITFTATATENKLVLKAGTEWHGVKADGTLAEAKANPAAAAADAEELAVGAVDVKVINQTVSGYYDLYILSPRFIAASTTIDSVSADFNTGGNNVILDLAGLTHGQFVAMDDGSTGTNTKVVVLTANGLAEVSAATTNLASNGEINGLSGLDYVFSNDGSLTFNAGSTATYAAIGAGDTWFIITSPSNVVETSIKAKTHD